MEWEMRQDHEQFGIAEIQRQRRGGDEIREVNKNQIIMLRAIFEAPTPHQATNLSILHI